MGPVRASWQRARAAGAVRRGQKRLLGGLLGPLGPKEETWQGPKSSANRARAILDPPIESVLAQKGPQRAFQEGSKRGRNRRVTEKEREAKNTIKHNGFEHFLASEGAQNGLKNDSKSLPTRRCDGRRPKIGAKTAPRGPSERNLKVGRLRKVVGERAEASLAPRESRRVTSGKPEEASEGGGPQRGLARGKIEKVVRMKA